MESILIEFSSYQVVNDDFVMRCPMAAVTIPVIPTVLMMLLWFQLLPCCCSCCCSRDRLFAGLLVLRMKVGFSLFPGGLLFPYHLGVLEGLASKGILHANTPLAGASAGAIAVACHGCGLDGPSMLEATAELSAQCTTSSKLLTKGLKAQMQSRIGPEHVEQLKSCPAVIGIAYRQTFSQVKSILQAQFDSVDDLADAVCDSSEEMS